jgi:hypothetical protein
MKPPVNVTYLPISLGGIPSNEGLHLWYTEKEVC